MSAEPQPEKLKTASFAVHVTRGVLRDRGMRRKTILALLVVAVLMVLLGSTVLKRPLDPLEHVGWFAIYWLICGWLTLTVMLMAMLDLLIVRSEARAARRRLREEGAPAPARPNEE